MVRYAYNRQVTPPAPFVHVSLQNLMAGTISDNLAALVDTGADRTVIPSSLVEALGLVPLDELPFAGLGGHLVHLRTYLVEIAIRGFPPRELEVVAHHDEPYILLGRDLLNQQRILLDGPGMAFEID
jgi:predicted aspartyl protease